MQKLLEKIREHLGIKSPLYLKVKVLPKSPKNEIVEQMDDGTYKLQEIDVLLNK